jgi:hypothetical protein
MPSRRIYRLAGNALLIAVVAAVAALFFSDLVWEGSRPVHAHDALWSWINILALGSGTLALFAFTAAYARQAERTGWMGLLGWLLTSAAGMLITVGFTTVYMIAVPLLNAADQRMFDPVYTAQGHPTPSLALYLLVATLMFTIGTVLFGLATVRARVFPAWPGWLLVLAGALAVVLTVVRLAQPTLPPIVGDAHFVVYLVAQGGLGWWLAARDAAPAPAAAAQPAGQPLPGGNGLP